MKAPAQLPPMVEPKRGAPALTSTCRRSARGEELENEGDARMRDVIERRALGPVQAKEAVDTAYGNLIAVARARPQKQDASKVQWTAAMGVSRSSVDPPHLERVQRALGRYHDLSNVRAHIGGPAGEAVQRIGAEAYTTGHHVAFQQAPGLGPGAHVVQQHAGVQFDGGVSQVGDRHEQQADAVANRVVAGQSTEDLLQVSHPLDRSEREADQIAEALVQSDTYCASCSPTASGARSEPIVQHFGGECAKKDDASVLRVDELATTTVSRRASEDPSIVDGPVLSEIEAAGHGGQQLSSAVRAFFEPRLGVDLGAVHIHTGARSAALSQALGASAFTRGSDIFFGASEFDPGSTAGRKLLAHELVHTVQQRAVSRPALSKHGISHIDAPRVQRQVKPGKKASRPFLSVPWKGDLRSSLFSYLRSLGTNEEEAARVTGVLMNAIDTYYRNGKKVSREEFETHIPKTFVLYPEITDSLLEYYHTDVQRLRMMTELGKFAEDMRLSLSGPEVPDAASAVAELKKQRQEEKQIRSVAADWTVLEKDPELAQFYLVLMQHYGGVELDEQTTKAATDGLSQEELTKIVGNDVKRKYLTGLFTQAYREFTAAGGKDVAAFKPLIERIIEQTAWGNPTATRNLLKVGEGWPERGRLGITHRVDGTLLYDELAQPLPSFAGTMMRDPGYIGVKQFSWGIDVSAIDDPALKGILTSLKQQIGDPARAVVLGAQNYFDNMEYVNARVSNGLPAEILHKFEDMLPIVLGFLAGHGLSTILIRMPPPWTAIGAALKGLLIAAGYVLQLDFAGSVLTRVLNAGYHLSRVQRDSAQALTELSKYHVEEAAAPLRSLVADIAAMVIIGKLMEVLRGGKRASLKCASPCDAEFEGKGKGKERGIEPPAVKKPTAEAYPLIDEYVRALSDLRGAMDKSDAVAQKSAREAMDRIERIALENADKGGPYDQLLRHIDTLADMRSSIEKGTMRFPVEEQAGSGKLVEGMGRRFAYLCVKLGLKRGMTFSLVEQILGWPPTRSPEVRPKGRVRLTWQLGDNSLVHLDIPGSENTSPYELSRYPHLAFTAPPPYESLHLSEDGVGVPFDSTPAHVEIKADDRLTYHLEPLRKAAQK